MIAEITLQTDKTHSERLMPHIDLLLTMAGISGESLDGIAASIGPGSFTGLTIGLATAKALAFAWDVPLVGIPTLAAAAYSCLAPGVTAAVMLDAQKGNVYLAVYTWDENADGIREVAPVRVLSFAAALEMLAALPGPVVVAGEVAADRRQDLIGREGIVLAPPHAIMPRAGTVAVLGARALAAGNGCAADAADALEPLYVRRSEAEELWERRHRRI